MYDDAYPLWDGTDYTDNVKEKEMKYQMPEPAAKNGYQKIDYYTATQVQAAFDAGRVAGLEEAAKECDKYGFGQAPQMIQNAIRNLKETPCA